MTCLTYIFPKLSLDKKSAKCWTSKVGLKALLRHKILFNVQPETTPSPTRSSPPLSEKEPSHPAPHPPLWRQALSDCWRAMRWHQPWGAMLLFLPGWWMHTCQAGWSLDRITLVLGAGSFWARGLGCVWNDWCDRAIDAQVPRTRHRPFALATLKAHAATTNISHTSHLYSQSFCGRAYPKWVLFWTSLWALPTGAMLGAVTPPSAWAVAAISACAAGIYPLTKKYTRWPQVFLAPVFSAAVPMTWVLDRARASSYAWPPALVVIMLFAAAAVWVFFYDTLYAIQDEPWDKSLGIGSSALALGPKRWAVLAACIMVYTLLHMGILVYLSATNGGASLTLWMGLIGLCALGGWQWHHLVRLAHHEGQPATCMGVLAKQCVYGAAVGAIFACQMTAYKTKIHVSSQPYGSLCSTITQ